jgi:signal peptidase I
MSGILRALIWVAVIVGALFAIGYYGYFDVWVVPTDDPRLLVSIEPTLRGGDLLLVERHGLPALGNLVRCVDPDEPRRYVVGRVVGVPNAALHLSDQTFSTQGSHPSHPSACEPQTLTNPATADAVELTCHNEEFAGVEYRTLSRAQDLSSRDPDTDLHVPPAAFFLLSDDRYLHLDSRDFGSLPTDACRHVLFRLWGADGFADGSRRFNITW